MASNLGLIASPTFNATGGKFGGAFTGGVGTTATNVLPNTGGFTAEALFNFAGGSGTYLILGSVDTFWVGVSSGALAAHFGLGTSEGVITSSIAVTAGWHHAALVCGTAGTTLFLDGAVAGTSTQTFSGQGATFANPIGVRGFNGYTYNTYQWQGSVDEVAFWSGARYSTAFTPPVAPYAGSETGLLALYHLDSDGTDSRTAPPVPSMGTAGVSGTVAGGAMVVGGSYANGVPGGLTYSLDGGAASAASGASISGGVYSFTIVAPAIGAHTISVTGTGGNTATSPTISFTTTATGFAIAPSNVAFVYSPYNWQVLAGVATAWNPGAYFRVLFSGSSCTLNFDVSAAVAPLSQLWWRVDNGPWTQVEVAAAIACAIPAITNNNADIPYHRLDVVVKSIDSGPGVNRWVPPTPGAIRFTGLTLGNGAGVLTPSRAALNVLVYGDSITEGIRTLGETGASPDFSDAMFGWAYALGALLGAEVGLVGFGGTGYLTSLGQVPVFSSSYGLIAAGVPRVFSPAPDLVVVNHGTNDGGGNVQAAAVSALNGLLAAVSCRVALLNPLPTSDNGYLQAAVLGCSAPSRAAFVSTAGFFVKGLGSDSIQLHPSGPNATALIAPRVAAALQRLLPAAAIVARWTH